MTLIPRLLNMTADQISAGIADSHPEGPVWSESDSTTALDADAVAMELIHGRHDKREIVNLVRWLLMGAPSSLTSLLP